MNLRELEHRVLATVTEKCGSLTSVAELEDLKDRVRKNFEEYRGHDPQSSQGTTERSRLAGVDPKRA